MKLNDIKPITESLQPFDTKRTDMPTFDNMLKRTDLRDYFKREKGLEYEVVEMTPAEYIKRCVNGFQSNSPTRVVSRASIESERNADDIKAYAEKMKTGEKFPMPVLTYERLFSQEGLHRAFAAELAGVDKMPVMIIKQVD
jgi:hypothetical protein